MQEVAVSKSLDPHFKNLPLLRFFKMLFSLCLHFLDKTVITNLGSVGQVSSFTMKELSTLFDFCILFYFWNGLF
jgi:hypothetical protein